MAISLVWCRIESFQRFCVGQTNDRSLTLRYSKWEMARKRQQDYSNHVNYVPLYHYLTFAAMAILIIGATYNLIIGKTGEALLNTLFLLLVLTLVSVSFHNRS